MFEERDLKIDLLALGLLALTVFLAASLLSYSPSDPPSRLVYPPSETVANLCGHSGAIVSHILLTGFGLGAYFLLASLAFLTAVLLARHEITEPLVRLTGWLLALSGVCTIAQLALPELSPGPVIGAGGYLGAVGRGLLEMHFASVGAYIVVVSFTCVGLFLATDYILLRGLAWVVWRAFGPVLWAGRVAAQRAGVGREANEDEDGDYEDDEYAEDEDEFDEAGGPAVVKPGQNAGTDEEDGASNIAAEESSQETGDSQQGETETAQPGGLMAALRIRKPRRSKREEMIEEIEAAASTEGAADYELPSLELLLESEPFNFTDHEKEVRRQAKLLEKTFANFGFNVRVVEIQTGPVISQFEVELEAGLRLSKITGLADDLAIALRVPSVRIVAPIPGKNTVGIEVPNTERQLVRMREVIEETNGKAQAMRIPIFLGKDVSGNALTVDLSTLPHLLIAGRTGTGKSVCLNSIIVSMLMSRRPDEVRMLLIDPKMVELSPYKKIPHLMHPVVTDMRKAEAILAWAVEKMEERYQLLARAGVRHLSVYNQLGEEELRDRIDPESDEEWEQIPKHMPYIVIVADEMADLMMTAAKEVEAHIIRLAQKSRAVGIHLVLATQKPTVDVITGLIKSNLPARIAFEVSSRTDSRVVLDEMGADKLLGNGDMLFLRPGTSSLIRGQGTYLSDDEIGKVIDAVATTEPQFVRELVQLKTDDATEAPTLTKRDDLYEGAVDIVVREGRGSVSLLQRTLGIGYGRAARLIDYMEEDGIVGPYNGSQAREILMTIEDWEAMRGGGRAPLTALDSTPKPARASKITMSAPSPDFLDSGETETGPVRSKENVPWEEDDVEAEIGNAEAEEAWEDDRYDEEEGDEEDDFANDEYDDEVEYEAYDKEKRKGKEGWQAESA
ncbi:MAG: DNA translocase FtsK [Planctomycetaceae bacterium]|nr:DNA translocase FtsK [Planctomycetaceae bacterium]